MVPPSAPLPLMRHPQIRVAFVGYDSTMLGPAGVPARMEDWIHPDDLEVIRETLSCMAPGEHRDLEARCLSGDPTITGWRWYRFFLSADTDYVQMGGLDITASRRRDRMLAQTQAVAHVGGWELDLQTNELYWTDETWRLHDLEPNALALTVEMAVSFYTARSREALQPALQQAMLGKPYSLELEIVTATGRNRWVHTTGAVSWEDGQPVRLYGSFQDITERRQVEQALRDSEQRLQLALSASDLGFWEWDVGQDLAHQDPEWLRKVGHQGEPVLPGVVEQIRQFLHPDDLPLFDKALLDHLAGLTPNFELEYRLLIDSAPAWLKARGKVVEWDPSGHPRLMLGTVQDISQVKQASEALDHLEGRWRSLVMTSPDTIVITDVEGLVQFVNLLPLADLAVGKLIYQLVPHAQHERVRDAIRRVLAGERWVEYESESLEGTQSGTWLVRLVRLSTRELMFVARDISQRIAMERALRESEALHRMVLEAAPDAIITVDGTGKIRSFNQAAERMFGYSREEAGQLNMQVLLPDAPPGDLSPWPIFRRPVFGRRKDGSRFPIELSAADAQVDGQELHTGVLKDATELHREKTQLMLADRLVSIGMLAAGVVHEISSPLTNIISNLGFVQLLAQEHQLSEERHRNEIEAALEESAIAGGQIRDIIQDLRLFSRMGDSAVGAVDLARVISWVTRMLRKEINRKAQLVLQVDPVPLVVGNELRLGQVFTNLMVNAIQALPAVGVERNRLRLRVYRKDAERVAAEVTDNGPGIPAEIRARIFDAFFTTKPVGEGTGLGLAICQDVVQALGGEIELESEVGVGTTFRVLLPVAPGAKKAEDLPVLLVVDPVPAIARSLQRGLEGRYKVVAETDGREALKRVRSGQLFAAVLYDLGCPGLSGQVFLEVLANIAPGLAQHCFFSTSSWDMDAQLLSNKLPPHRILEKPFEARTLEERLTI